MPHLHLHRHKDDSPHQAHAGDSPHQEEEPRFEGEHGEEKDVSLVSFFGPFMKNYASTLSSTHGNPARLPYPPRFYLHKSSLQVAMSSKLAYVGLLESANSRTDHMQRFLEVLKYFFCTLSLTKFPYKPIIAEEGETSHNYVNHGTSQTYSIAEEIAHDPPHAAFHISNPARGITYDGNLLLEPQFSKGSVRVKINGFNRIVLHRQGFHDELYEIANPEILIKMLRMSTEIVGEAIVQCLATGISAKITFKEKPMLGGSKGVMEGAVHHAGHEVFRLSGIWDDVIILTNPTTNERSELLNKKTYPRDKIEIPEGIPPTASERVWGQLIDLLHNEKFTEAQNWKMEHNQQENAQRAVRQQNNVQPTFFSKDPAGQWLVKDSASAMAYIAK